MESYENAQKIMQQRMLKNLAFFGRNKIAQSLQTALNGGNRKFNLYFDRNEINIIDLANKRFLYPKGAFVSVAQNIAQTPLNNDKWKIYANNLRLAKLQKNSVGGYGVANLNITAEAINKIVEIAESTSICLSERSEESQKESSLRTDSQNLGENNSSLRDSAKQNRGNPLCEIIAESTLDSATRTLFSPLNSLSFSQKGCTPHPAPPTRQKLPLFAFRGRASLSPLLAKNQRSHYCSLESDFLHHEAGEFSGASHGFSVDSADSQNLGENNSSLRALRSNHPPIEKNIDLQGGLPRATSRARNDEFKDFAESRLISAHSTQEANSAIADEFLGFCEASDEDRTQVHRGSEPKQSLKSRYESKFALDSANPYYHLPPLFLPQTNIFGLCGGLFLDILVENGYFFHSLLIYEEEAELFALSCYFVDYERLFSRTSPKSCYIFIENLLDKGLLNHYFYSKKITNNFLRLELSLLQSPKTRDFKALTFETYKANARGWGSFEDEMVGLKHTFANAKNAPFLRIDSKLKTPICVVGSGPSLESNINFIRANQNKMLIFSCGTALKVLKKHKIAIDFQIEIERVPYLAEVLQNSNLGDTAILCASLVDSKVLEVAQSATLFMRGGSAASYIFGDATQEIAPLEFCAPFVGNAGFSLACALSDEVIMCGMDCGFVKGFAKHSSGSIYGDESAEIPRDCFRVEGNDENFEVFSNAIFSLSKESFALSIAHYKPKIVHNLSFGAKINGANFTQSLSLKNRSKKTPLNSRFVKKTAIDNAKQSLKNSALKFIDELQKALNYDNSKPISTKQELFCYIDSITDFLAKISEKNPKIGILFEGSISHLLQSAMIALLSVKKNAISAEFEACKAVILGACEAYKREIGDL